MAPSRTVTILAGLAAVSVAGLAFASPVLAEEPAGRDASVHLPPGVHLPLPEGPIPFGGSTLHYQSSDFGRDVFRVGSFPGLDQDQAFVLGGQPYDAYGEPFVTNNDCLDFGNLLLSQGTFGNFYCQWLPIETYQLFVQ